MPADLAPTAPRYRADIDGLRALAILPVVFYHFRIPGFGGGFVGVDIFFVISGYLITGLLTATDRKLSLFDFYARRIRRLGPALAVMLAATTLAAFVLLPPNPFIAYGKSLVSVAIGGSNLFFWRALASYFAPSGENHLLLHTWSLAVEEQFYLVFPLFLAGLRPWGRRGLAIGVGGAALISLALAAVMASRAPSASFYLAPTRAWELLAGALLVLRPALPPLNRAVINVAGGIGLALIFLAVATFTVATRVPGPAALLPCLGAVLLLLCGELDPANPVSRLLAARPLVGVGLISYALYLWHWPINVFLRRYILVDPPSPALALMAILLAAGLAIASYVLIERPIRHGQLRAGRFGPFLFAGVMAAILIGLGTWIAASQGLPQRFPDLDRVRMQVADRDPPYRLLTIGRPAFDDRSGWLVQRADPTAHRVLIWGDSYATHLTAGFAALQDQYPFAVYQQVSHGCPPVIGFEPRAGHMCRDRNDVAMKIIADERIDTVILGGRWQNYTQTGKLDLGRIAQTVSRLQSMGLKVLVVGQPPDFRFDFPDEYHLLRVRRGAALDTGWAISTVEPRYNEWLNHALGGIVFDPSPTFCANGQCLYRDHGLYLVRDNGHLTAYGSQRLVAALLKTPLLQQAGAAP